MNFRLPMYVIVSPCVYDQSLRAEGITTQEDCDVFVRCQERCREFQIQTIQYRCPETSYFGKHRPPRSFSEMDSLEYSLFLNEVETEIHAIIEQHGEPAAIIGVDSSPTCGIRFTYQTSVKQPGRGALLARFAVRGIDVKDFARYRILLITHQDEDIQPLIEYLNAGYMRVTRYEVPGNVPPFQEYDLCIVSDASFFEYAQAYCSSEYIMMISDLKALSSFILS